MPRKSTTRRAQGEGTIRQRKDGTWEARYTLGRDPGYVTSEDVKAILQKLNIRVRLNDISGMVEIDGMPPQYSRTNAANVLPVILTDVRQRLLWTATIPNRIRRCQTVHRSNGSVLQIYR